MGQGEGERGKSLSKCLDTSLLSGLIAICDGNGWNTTTTAATPFTTTTAGDTTIGRTLSAAGMVRRRRMAVYNYRDSRRR